MRIGLLSEGTYPVVHGGVSTWTDQLITRLPDHEFAIVTLVGSERTVLRELPGNVTSLTLAPMWDPIPRAPMLRTGADQREVTEAVAALWAALLPAGGGPIDLTGATEALRVLTRSRRTPLAALLARAGSARAVLTAWEAHAGQPGPSGATRTATTGTALPGLALREAAEVARLADRMLGVADIDWPQVDLIHVASNGPAALVGLARHWADGTPLLLTEHGVYLRERYLALAAAGMTWAVRYALMRLTTAICRIAYQEADRLAPVSAFNARWEEELGADPDKVVVIHNGADPKGFSPVTTEPDVPTVSFVGRIDPLKDLHTLIEAFELVRRAVPTARLRLFGPTEPSRWDYRASLDALVERLDLGSAVTFEGGIPSARPAIEAGHVVALSSISEGLPFTVIEAMMCGRPTVNTDVGGVAECTGTDGVAGVVVPPRDPAALAQALVELLGDEQGRARMGLAARDRALRMFSLDVFEERYRRLYHHMVTAGAANESRELLAVGA